jgi:hypothetical protein
MPEPTAAPVHDGNPISWDELFPPDSSGAQQADNSQKGDQQPPAVQAPAQPVAPVPAAFELRTKTGSVYKSQEDAIKGIEHKDALIEQLRHRYILERGVDPLTGQPVQLAPVQQTANYMTDPKRYYTDLVSAAQKNDPDAVWKAQTQLIFDALQPLAPVMANLAKQQAVESLSSSIKDIREFLGSENYSSALKEVPDLKDAIERAEQDYTLHAKLPGLYKVAYQVSQGLRLPEILKSQPTTTTQPVRPTTAPTTLPPPQSGAQPNLTGNEARKALISQMEASGVADSVLL